MNRVVIDTEGTGTPETALVYDLGLVVVDKDFHVIREYRALVEEIFNNQDLMTSAYYARKLPAYYDAIEAGNVEVKPFITIWREVADIIKTYKVHEVWAHNASYDRAALNRTLETLSNGFRSWFMPYGTQWHCTQAAAAATICKLQRYFNFVLSHNMITRKGNVPTSAEAVYAFLNNNPDYYEEHTALQDARDESVILRECKRRRVHKRDTYPTRYAWKRPQSAFKEWLAKR